MCKWVYSKAGYKFILTELGLEDSRIRAKFNSDYERKLNYEKTVPESWVKKGYVTEVKCDDC